VSGIDRLLAALPMQTRIKGALGAAAAISALAIVLPFQVYRLQLEIADYRDLGDYHRKLVAMYRAVQDRLPRDRPLVVANLAGKKPLQELAHSYRGYPKVLFVRPLALWELVHFAPLANFAGSPFIERFRPIPPTRLAQALQSDFCCLLFTDDGFVIDEEHRDTLREAYRQRQQLPERAGAYERVPADTIDE
jgi:hypothetical protein